MIPSFALRALALGVLPLALAQQHVPVTGVQGGNVGTRLNINDLQAKGGPTWDLYLRSLDKMYSLDAHDQLSYFQIAGIHGKPNIEWNHAGPKNTDGWAGYCPHGEEIFLPWHRPFVLLFEQQLVSTAKSLASEYPEDRRAEYVSAAAALRAPYWDWAAAQDVPSCTVPAQVTVNIPGDGGLRSVSIANPLASFKMPKAAIDGEFGDFDNANRTVRCPAPESYPVSANGDLQRRAYKQWTYDTLTLSKDFLQFASTKSNGVSLEQIHNAIHWDGACGQQFLASDYAAFDPLFMMHHCQVDRIWAYWEFMHPESSLFNETYVGGARFSTPNGTRISPDSPLSPFYQSNGEFHTSKSVKSIQGFGYTYEGLEYWQKSPDVLKQDAISLINNLYSPNGTSSAQPSSSVQPSSSTSKSSAATADLPRSLPSTMPSSASTLAQQSTVNRQVSQPGSGAPATTDPTGGVSTAPSAGSPPATTSSSNPIDMPDSPAQPGTPNPDLPDVPLKRIRRRVFVDIEVDKKDVQGPCRVDIYVGHHYADCIFILQQPTQGMFHGQIPVDAAVQKAGLRPALLNGTDQSISSQIRLEIRKSQRDNSIVPLSKIPSLKVHLANADYQLPSKPNELPKVGPLKTQPAPVQPAVSSTPSKPHGSKPTCKRRHKRH